MNTPLPDVRGTRPGADRLHEAPALRQVQPAMATATTAPASVGAFEPAPSRVGALWSRIWTLDIRWRYPLVIFVLSRVVYLAIAGIDHFVRRDNLGHHWSLGRMVSNWDGFWYLAVTAHGYYHHVDLTQWNTLGFLPLYPMLMWVLAHALPISDVLAGMIVTTISAAIATVLIGRLATRWWGEQASRRAVLFFCVFPGSIVFSMLYTEGLLLALVAGCLLALEDRRWVLAGVLAGLSTAVGPVAMGIIPACIGAAYMEIRRRGWADREALRSLAAPVLAPLGGLGFAIFLWVWTGTPLASYQTQKVDWHETTTPLALPRAVVTLTKQAIGVEGPPHPNIDLNLIIAVLGTAFLVWGIVHLWRWRERVPVPALIWTAAVAFMTLTSNSTPPNARMLLCAFPVIMVIGADLRGRAYRRLLACSGVMLVAMSMITFVSTGLRP